MNTQFNWHGLLKGKLVLQSRPLYMRFFGLGLDQFTRKLSQVLGRNDVYFVHVDHYEIVLEIVKCRERPDQIKNIILNHFGSWYIGDGRQTSIEQIVGNRLINHHLSITGAESLTAGMFQATLGNVPGISAVFPGGFVTYSNHAKHQLLGIPNDVINEYGVVSEPVAQWMASQSRKIMNTDVSVSFTGAAGPDPLEGQPGGTVWIGLSINGHKTIAKLYHLQTLYHQLSGFKTAEELKNNSRDAIRLLCVKTGLKMVNDALNKLL